MPTTDPVRRRPPPPGPSPREDVLLDEALEETFPASDPIALAPKRGGKDDKRMDCAVKSEEPQADTSDAKTPSNMKAFHKAFERRRR